MEILPMLSMKLKTNQDSKRGFLIKALLKIQWSIRVRFLIPNNKMKKVVGLMLIDLFVLNVEEHMMASVLWIQVIAIIFARVGT